jgi:hypothetical protein
MYLKASTILIRGHAFFGQLAWVEDSVIMGKFNPIGGNFHMM